jgi:D-alanine-D-alanine ligase
MEKKKINVGLLFGGKSAEHEISLKSAKNVIEAIDKNKYNPILIGIDKNGGWLFNNKTGILLNPQDEARLSLNPESDQVALVPQSEGKMANLSNGLAAEKIDVVFPILHGPFGEDGTIQGLLKLANVPFVGAGVLGSAVGMDKDVMKRLLRDAGLPVGKFITLRRGEQVPVYSQVVQQLGEVCFVKPANLGSSVGINRAANAEEYAKAVEEAFLYDNKIIIEEFIAGREIECAILGNENPQASVVGEISFSDSFYSYDAKYIDEGGYRIDIPAKLDEDIQEQIQEIALRTFKVLECEGFARVDVFLTAENRIIVNEINTIPGFTKISMYPKLWEASGLPYTALISRLIELAMDRFEREKQIKTSR